MPLDIVEEPWCMPLEMLLEGLGAGGHFCAIHTHTGQRITAPRRASIMACSPRAWAFAGLPSTLPANSAQQAR